jgi:hypothetical protein
MIVAPRLTQQLQQRRILIRALLFVSLLLASSLIISLLSLSAKAQTPQAPADATSQESARRSFCQLREFRMVNASSIRSAVTTIAALDVRAEARFQRMLPALCPGAQTQHEAQLFTALRAGFLSGALTEDLGIRTLMEMLGTQGLKEISPSAVATNLILAVAELRQWQKSPDELAQLRRRPAQFEQLMRTASAILQSTAAARDQLINGDRELSTEPTAPGASLALPSLANPARPTLMPGRSDQEMHRSRQLGARLNATPNNLRHEACEQDKQAGRLPADTVCR